MKKIFRPVALLLAFLTFIFLFNYLVDPANVFYERYEETVADILLSGNNAEGVENMDDRRFLRLYASSRTQPIDTLVLGSSRAMQITRAVTGDPNTFVAGVTGSDLRDCISAYFLFENEGFRPKTVVLSLEFWYLSQGNMDTRALTEEYEIFCRKIGSTPVVTTSASLNKLKNFFSFTYFQSSVEYLVKGKRKYLPFATTETNAVSAVKRVDGSYGYEESLREQSQAVIDSSARDKQVVDNIAAGFSGVSPSLSEQLDAFVGYLQQQGIQVRLLLSPVHPLYYDYMLENPDVYSIVFDSESFYRSVGGHYGVSVYGSFSPALVGANNYDFYDEVHPRESAVARYYNLEIKK